jgi:hypothetical protein
MGQNQLFNLVNIYAQSVDILHQRSTLIPNVKKHLSPTYGYMKGVPPSAFQAPVQQNAIIVQICDFGIHRNHL